MILTHNILNECSIQESLQKINFEVFVSKTMLDMILYTENQWEVGFYPIIILSESLSNKELKKIIPKLKNRRVVIFRKYLSEPMTEEKDTLKELEIDEWVDQAISPDSLREIVSKYVDFDSTINHMNKSQVISMSFNQLVMGFTKNQTKCFEHLYNARSLIISREDLCTYIWGAPLTKSHLAQLSILIKTLKRKLEEKGFPSDIIETVWGKGYVLKEEFYSIYRETNLSNK
ncbi:helix-turn-helix domain-containing protein [Enterococcus avium]|uniref:winged helix-turn-helix domain-containing protein n=2 Tax=Enterococcus avium TaxID=33945 RepID=UPI0035114CC6